MPTAWPARGPRSFGGAGSFPKVRGRSAGRTRAREARLLSGGRPDVQENPRDDQQAAECQQECACDAAAIQVPGGRRRRGQGNRRCRRGGRWLGRGGRAAIGGRRDGGRIPGRRLGARVGGGRRRLGARRSGNCRGARSGGPSGRGFGGDRIAGRGCCRDRRCLGFWTVRGRRADQRRDDPSGGVAGGARGRQCEDQGRGCQHQRGRDRVAGPFCRLHPIHRRGAEGAGGGPRRGPCRAKKYRPRRLRRGRYLEIRASCQNRTGDLLITSETLYQLS